MKNNNKILKRKSVLFTWMISYIIILTLPIIISIIMYMRVEEIVKDGINRENNFYLTQIQQQTDNIVDEVKKFSMDIAFDYNIQDVINYKPVYTGKEQYEIYKCANMLKTFKGNSLHIEDAYIFLNNSNMVLDDTGVSGMKEFFDVKYGAEVSYFNKWTEILKNSHKGDFVKLKEAGNKIFYMLSLPVIRNDEATANLVISIDDNKFSKTFYDSQNTNKGEFFILDKSNNLIISPKGDNILNGMNYGEFPQDRDMFYKEYKGNKEVISYVTSKSEEWKYIYAMPESIFLEKLQGARKVIYMSMVICILMGITMVYILLKRNYAPMEKLLEELGGKEEGNAQKDGDEYQFIHKIILKTMNEKVEYENRLLGQNSVLKSRFIEKLLKGNNNDISINDSLVAFDMQFKSDYFAVMLIYIDDFSEKFLEKTNNDINEAFKLVRFVFTNVLEEMLKNKFQCYITESDGMLAVILNLDNQSIEVGKIEIKEITKELQSFINKYYKINLTIALSNIHETTLGIAEAYKETLEAMDYKIVMGLEGVINYDETKYNFDKEYYYPIEKEQQLINCVKVGEYENAKKILDDIFKDNYEDRSLSPQMAKCLILNMVSTMLKIIHELNTIVSEDFEEELAKIEKIVQYKNLKTVKSAILGIIKNLCDTSNQERKNKSNKTKEKIDEYIIENYKNENLSISLIAEYFNMHPCYISRVYKVQAGESILDFINKIRIEKSKEILKVKKLTLEEVCKEVGYFNVRTFSRTFVKLEGITPGKYKEAN